MLVFLETRMSFSEPCVFLQKHACSSESMYVQRKTLRTKAYVIVNRGVFHVTPVRRPNLVFHFDCSFMPAGIFRDDSLLLPRCFDFDFFSVSRRHYIA